MRLLAKCATTAIFALVFCGAWALISLNLNVWGTTPPRRMAIIIFATALGAVTLIVFGRIECGTWVRGELAFFAAVLALIAAALFIVPAVERLLRELPALELSSSTGFIGGWYLLVIVLGLEGMRPPLASGKKWIGSLVGGGASMLLIAVLEVQFRLPSPGGYESLGRLVLYGPIIWVAVVAAANILSPSEATTPVHPKGE